MSIDWSKAPEGATHKAKNGGFFKLDVSGVSMHENGEWKKLGWASWQIEGFEKRPPAWNGEGLPPVGTVCEYYADENTWRRCEIVAHKDGKAVVWVNHVHIWSSAGAGLRPIRTPDQIAAEERDKAVKEMLALDPYLHDTALGLLSRADFCRKLYDAGYRKAEGGDL